jgi:hypothetical protein
MLMGEEKEKIFYALREILAQYSPPFSVAEKRPSLKDKKSYEVVSYKEVEIDGRKKSEIYFAGIIIQKSYVGFYYMLAYANPKIRSALSKDFLKMLKGKSCFYIKDTNPETLSQIRKALNIALVYYQERGWV